MHKIARILHKNAGAVNSCPKQSPAVALYALLRPVNKILALLGAFWRVANAIVLGVGVAASLAALRVLNDVQMQAMARQLLDIHGAGMLIGLIFFSLGAAVHSYLFWKSKYIPRVLSGPYLVVALLILAGSFAIILFPSFAMIDPWFVLPDFIVESLVALWLVIKGANIPAQQLQPTA